MIDFQNIVTKLLLEDDPSVPAATTAGEEIDKTGFDSFLSQQVYVKLQQLWQKKYPNYSFVSMQEIKIVAYTAMENSKRNTHTSKAFPKIKDIFPLLDLFAGIRKVYQKGGTKDIEIAKRQLASFIKKVETSTSLIPLDYSPNEPWAHAVRQDYYADTQADVGQLRIEKLNPNLSFYYVVYNLLAIRKKGLDKKLSDKDKNVSGVPYIDTVLLNISNVISGTEPVRDQKIRNIYDEGAANALMTVSKAAYQLYKQQIETIVGSLEDSTAKSESQDLLKNTTRYAEFMGKGNNAAQLFIWTKPVKKEESVSFDILHKAFLDEFMSIGMPPEPEPAAAPEEDEQQRNKKQPFEIEPGSKQYKYSLGKLKEAVGMNLPTAINLMKALEGLADYIRTQEEIDWKGAARALGQIGQTLGSLTTKVGL